MRDAPPAHWMPIAVVFFLVAGLSACLEIVSKQKLLREAQGVDLLSPVISPALSRSIPDAVVTFKRPSSSQPITTPCPRSHWMGVPLSGQ